MKIAICDDNLECIRDIKCFFDSQDNSEYACDEYKSGESLLEILSDNPLMYDIIFLDMEMTGIDGIETGKLIREKNDDVVIIFVTAYEQYMKKSFECRPFRFLTKPLNEKELELSFRDAEKYLAKRKRICTLTDKRNTIRLLYDNILYCECNGHWIIIHTKDEEIKLFMSMKELIAYFDNTSIYRVHKSFAVNFKYIQTIKDNRILLNEKRVELPLGRAYKETVYNQYTEYFERSLYI